MNDESEMCMDDDFDDDLMAELICQNCSCFFHHDDDDDCMGICSLDEGFESCWEDDLLMEKIDFSCCRELYLQKCFDGLREACDKFENAMMNIPEGMSVDTYLHIKALKDADTSDLYQCLHQTDRKSVLRALDRISYFARQDNHEAYDNLIRFCLELGPATSLKEVEFRVELVKILSSLPRAAQIVDAYVRELTRTPSNNMTRRLYTEILKELSRYPHDEIQAPIENLLSQTRYSYKIKRRIKEVAGLVETEDDSWF